MSCGRACGKAAQVADAAGVRTGCETFGHAMGATHRWESGLCVGIWCLRLHRDVGRIALFHSRCGCSSGEPVEKASKWLTCLCHARVAKYFVMQAPRGARFSTAAVDSDSTSLWTKPVAIFGDKHLACVDEIFDNRRGRCRARVFPQRLWMRAVQACGQPRRPPLTTGTCYDMAMFCAACVAQPSVFHSVCGAAWEKPVDRWSIWLIAKTGMTP